MEFAFLIVRILMALVLYAFLGSLIWLLWMQMRLQVERAAEKQFPDLILTRDQDDPQVFRFNRSEVIIGRQPGCDLKLMDGAISARHTRLSFHDGQWWAEDLQSRNGTFINEELLTAPVVLAGGDVLRCGGVQLQIAIQLEAYPIIND
jgi:pSer/pThr/pTyr-binding forkhead associated (FHA) protein